MKHTNLTLLIVVSGLLCACGTTDVYERRAEQELQRKTRYNERAVERAPTWMNKLPESTSAIYAAGTAVSMDMAMAEEKAKLIALAKICVAAGGSVDQQSRIYRNDTESSSSEQSEMAIQSRCRTVDVTGTEVREIKRVSEGDRFRAYVLVALPTGEANPLAQTRDQREARRAVDQRARDAFQRLE